MQPIHPELSALASRIRLLVLDVDGVLTDGRLFYGEAGEAMKAFHVRDGLGIRLLRNEGVEVAVISARSSSPVRRRVGELGLTHVYLGRDDKLAALLELLSETEHTRSEVAFVGDDVLDLLVMRQVGLAITVADGHWRVRQEADWVTRAPGGCGAVREVADGLLAAMGALERAIDALFAEHVGGGEPLL